MGHQSTKIVATTEYPMRAWLKTINTSNTIESLTSLYAGDVTQITYYPNDDRHAYQIYFAEDHNFEDGDTVTITGVNPFAAFNVTNAPIKVVDDAHISVYLPTSSTIYNSEVEFSATSYTNMVIKAHIKARIADLYAFSDAMVPNAADMYVGPTANNVGPTALLSPGDSLHFEAAAGGMLPLSSLNVYGTQGDGVIVYFH